MLITFRSWTYKYSYVTKGPLLVLPKLKACLLWHPKRTGTKGCIPSAASPVQTQGLG